MTLIPLFSEEPVELKSWQRHAPFVHSSQTSFDAARAIKTPSLRHKVLELLKTGSFTDEQISLHLQLNPSTARPRRVELEQMGLIEQIGIGTTVSGRSAALWRAIPTSEAS